MHHYVGVFACQRKTLPRFAGIDKSAAQTSALKLIAKIIKKIVKNNWCLFFFTSMPPNLFAANQNYISVTLK
jgi:hypothetical protein